MALENKLRNLTDDELLRHVDRTNPEVKELALRLEESMDALEDLVADGLNNRRHKCCGGMCNGC